MVKAEWLEDYDFRTDKIFMRPMHDCSEERMPIYKCEDGKYRCLGCGEEAEVDSKMKKWLDKRSEVKVETSQCMMCGKKEFVGTYYRNEVTLKWELGHGVCNACGCKIIV